MSSYLPAFTIAHVGIIAGNASIASPGNMMLGADYLNHYTGIPRL